MISVEGEKMTTEQKIENAIIWADALRKSRGSVSATYVDGNIKATSTADGVVVDIADEDGSK